MPMFEFECESCKHRFEELVSSTGKTVEICPECGEKKVRKLVSAGSFRANGGLSSGLPSPAPSCSHAGG